MEKANRPELPIEEGYSIKLSTGERIMVGILAASVIGGIGIGIATTTYSRKKEQKAEEVQTTKQTELSDVIVGDVGPDSVKVFDEGQHYISVRISAKNRVATSDIEGYAINNIPEGYEIYEITPYNTWRDRGSQTNGFDIWFVNTEPVEVHASYNDEYDQYGYFTFGEVVEEEKTLTK